MYSQLYVIQGSVIDSINNNDYSRALELISGFVVALMYDHKAPGALIGSRRLDELCEMIGDEYYKKSNFPVDYIANKDRVVIVCTGLYKYGGTSLLIGDIVKAHINSECTVLVTDFLGDMSNEDLEMSRIGNFSAQVVFAPKGNPESKMYWLMRTLTEIAPHRIILLNHHQDSVIISAVQPFTDKANVIFYHHADYNLCLGVHLKKAIHIDHHNVGFFNCRDNEGIDNNFYLPLTVADQGSTRVDQPFIKNGELVTCSSATYHKFSNFYLYRYDDLIVERLAIRTGVHIHIGNIPPHDLALIKSKMRERNIDLGRFVYVPWVPCLWKALVENSVDLFIGSFPIGGARTILEVMGAGIPTLMHENYISRFHSSRDLCYSDALLWKYPKEFFEAIFYVDEKILKQQSASSRNHYLANYSSGTVELGSEFDKICSGNSISTPYSLYPYRPDNLDKMLHFNHLELYLIHSGVRKFIYSKFPKITRTLRPFYGFYKRVKQRFRI